MLIYLFRVPPASDPVAIELNDDDEAWAQAITLCGEMLKDVDGKLPPGSEWNLTVDQGDRTVASINLVALRYPYRQP